MRALVSTGDERLVDLCEVADPVVQPGQMLIAVDMVSVNRGELRRLRQWTSGWRPGWDFAGRVAQSAPGGPTAGTKVFGMTLGGAWAERVSVSPGFLATAPEAADLADLAAIPVAALTALRVLRLAGDVVGKSVFISGAAGGVGRFVIQLARLFGAEVHAHVGRPERAQGLAGLGAHQVHVGAREVAGEFDVALDSIGGPGLEAALNLVRPGGMIVTFGRSAERDCQLAVGSFYARQLTLRGYHLLYDVQQSPPAADLAYLAGLHERGIVRVDREPACSWTEAAEVLHALERRHINGKAVLKLDAAAMPGSAPAPAPACPDADDPSRPEQLHL